MFLPGQILKIFSPFLLIFLISQRRDMHRSQPNFHNFVFMLATHTVWQSWVNMMPLILSLRKFLGTQNDMNSGKIVQLLEAATWFFQKIWKPTNVVLLNKNWSEVKVGKRCLVNSLPTKSRSSLILSIHRRKFMVVCEVSIQR